MVNEYHNIYNWFWLWLNYFGPKIEILPSKVQEAYSYFSENFSPPPYEETHVPNSAQILYSIQFNLNSQKPITMPNKNHW